MMELEEQICQFSFQPIWQGIHIEGAIKKAGHEGKVQLGMDVAASEFYLEKEKLYDLDFKTEKNDGSKKVNSE